MSYIRNDIQGLRGLCMIAIFVYHYNKNYIPSGVFGVDIFFIISGYVNTISIMNKNNYSYINFFCRRLIRLFPISFLGMLYSIIVINKFVIIQFQNKLLNDVLSCSLSLSNYRFFYLSINYVLQSESKSLVLHYWSLSVEDQFYIFFPLLFKIDYIKYINSLLFVSSYIYSIYVYCNNYSLLYFSTLCRIWEFLFGNLIVNVTKSIKYKRLIVLSICYIFYFNILVKYIPISSILPLFITSLVIINNDNSFDILSTNTLLKLGDISYPFYILHYIIMFRYKNSKFNIFYQFIVDIVISYVLYNTIVKISLKIDLKKRVIIFLYILSIFIIIYITRTIIKNNINIQIKKSHIKYSYIQINREWNNFFINTCKCNNFFQLNKPNNTILLLMDSHGEQWSTVYIPYAISLHYILLQIYYKDEFICNKNYLSLHSFLSQNRYFHYIIIAHSIHCINSKSTTFSKYIKYLLNYTNYIYIIQDTPHFTINPIDYIYTNKTNCYGIIGFNASIYKFPTVINNKIHVIDMNKYICINNYKCNFVINSIPVYKDSGHLTLQFTKSLRKEFLQELIFNNTNRIFIDNTCNYEYRCYVKDIL